MNYHRFSEHVEDLKVEVRLFSDFLSLEKTNKNLINK